jgi:hypothetical protein
MTEKDFWERYMYRCDEQRIRKAHQREEKSNILRKSNHGKSKLQYTASGDLVQEKKGQPAKTTVEPSYASKRSSLNPVTLKRMDQSKATTSGKTQKTEPSYALKRSSLNPVPPKPVVVEKKRILPKKTSSSGAGSGASYLQKRSSLNPVAQSAQPPTAKDATTKAPNYRSMLKTSSHGASEPEKQSNENATGKSVVPGSSKAKEEVVPPSPPTESSLDDQREHTETYPAESPLLSEEDQALSNADSSATEPESTSSSEKPSEDVSESSEIDLPDTNTDDEPKNAIVSSPPPMLEKPMETPPSSEDNVIEEESALISTERPTEGDVPEPAVQDTRGNTKIISGDTDEPYDGATEMTDIPAPDDKESFRNAKQSMYEEVFSFLGYQSPSDDTAVASGTKMSGDTDEPDGVAEMLDIPAVVVPKEEQEIPTPVENNEFFKNAKESMYEEVFAFLGYQSPSDDTAVVSETKISGDADEPNVVAEMLDIPAPIVPEEKQEIPTAENNESFKNAKQSMYEEVFAFLGYQSPSDDTAVVSEKTLANDNDGNNSIHQPNNSMYPEVFAFLGYQLPCTDADPLLSSVTKIDPTGPSMYPQVFNFLQYQVPENSSARQSPEMSELKRKAEPEIVDNAVIPVTDVGSAKEEPVVESSTDDQTTSSTAHSTHSDISMQEEEPASQVEGLSPETMDNEPLSTNDSMTVEDEDIKADAEHEEPAYHPETKQNSVDHDTTASVNPLEEQNQNLDVDAEGSSRLVMIDLQSVHPLPVKRKPFPVFGDSSLKLGNCSKSTVSTQDSSLDEGTHNVEIDDEKELLSTADCAERADEVLSSSPSIGQDESVKADISSEFDLRQSLLAYDEGRKTSSQLPGLVTLGSVKAKSVQPKLFLASQEPDNFTLDAAMSKTDHFGDNIADIDSDDSPDSNAFDFITLKSVKARRIKSKYFPAEGGFIDAMDAVKAPTSTSFQLISLHSVKARKVKSKDFSWELSLPSAHTSISSGLSLDDDADTRETEGGWTTGDDDSSLSGDEDVELEAFILPSNGTNISVSQKQDPPSSQEMICKKVEKKRVEKKKRKKDDKKDKKRKEKSKSKEKEKNDKKRIEKSKSKEKEKEKEKKKDEDNKKQKDKAEATEEASKPRSKSKDRKDKDDRKQKDKAKAEKEASQSRSKSMDRKEKESNNKKQKDKAEAPKEASKSRSKSKDRKDKDNDKDKRHKDKAKATKEKDASKPLGEEQSPLELSSNASPADSIAPMNTLDSAESLVRSATNDLPTDQEAPVTHDSQPLSSDQPSSRSSMAAPSQNESKDVGTEVDPPEEVPVVDPVVPDKEPVEDNKTDQTSSNKKASKSKKEKKDRTKSKDASIEKLEPTSTAEKHIANKDSKKEKRSKSNEHKDAKKDKKSSKVVKPSPDREKGAGDATTKPSLSDSARPKSLLSKFGNLLSFRSSRTSATETQQNLIKAQTPPTIAERPVTKSVASKAPIVSKSKSKSKSGAKSSSSKVKKSAKDGDKKKVPKKSVPEKEKKMSKTPKSSSSKEKKSTAVAKSKPDSVIGSSEGDLPKTKRISKSKKALAAGTKEQEKAAKSTSKTREKKTKKKKVTPTTSSAVPIRVGQQLEP